MEVVRQVGRLIGSETKRDSQSILVEYTTTFQTGYLLKHYGLVASPAKIRAQNILNVFNRVACPSTFGDYFVGNLYKIDPKLCTDIELTWLRVLGELDKTQAIVKKQFADRFFDFAGLRPTCMAVTLYLDFLKTEWHSFHKVLTGHIARVGEPELHLFAKTIQRELEDKFPEFLEI